MDPVSVVGLVGSIISIADVVAKSIRKLSDLRTADRNAPLQVTTLIGQLYIIQAVIAELTRWKSTHSVDDPRYNHLAAQIDKSLECFCPMITTLEQYLDNLEVFLLSNNETPDLHDRLSYLWNERDVATYTTLVDRQVNALSLFLQAVQCSTWNEQQKKIEEKESQNVLQLARDCTSSVIGLADRLSILSDNTNALSLQFDFDPILLGSQVYQVAHRSNVKQIIRAGRRHDQASTITSVQTVTEAHSAPETGLDPQPQSLTSLDIYKDVDSSISIQTTPPLSQRHGKSDQKPPLLSHKRGRSDQTLPTAKTEFGTKDGLRGMFRVPTLASLRKSKSQSQPMTQPGELPQSNTVLLTPPSRRKVMLLGTSESGKSTLFKVLKVYLNGDFSLKERTTFTETIFTNITQATRAVLDAMEYLGIFLDDDRKYFDAHIIQLQHSLVDKMTEELELAIASLWDDAGFKRAYRRRFEYQLNVNAKSFAEDIHYFAMHDFVPTISHILQSHVTTIDVEQTLWNQENCSLSVLDVGGARSQRRKWVNVAESISTILYTVDTTAYCKLLYEDERDNRMQEQLLLFGSVVNKGRFSNIPIILVMTHIDLLKETMELAPVQDWHSDLPMQTENRKLTIEEYLSYLYKFFAFQIKDEEKRHGLRVIYADLVHDSIQSLGETIMKVVI